jgi:hypothetical protein
VSCAKDKTRLAGHPRRRPAALVCEPRRRAAAQQGDDPIAVAVSGREVQCGLAQPVPQVRVLAATAARR